MLSDEVVLLKSSETNTHVHTHPPTLTPTHTRKLEHLIEELAKIPCPSSIVSFLETHAQGSDFAVSFDNFSIEFPKTIL